MRTRLLLPLLECLLFWWSAETFAQTLQTLKGVGFSPKSYQPTDFMDFFEKARRAGKVVMWAGDWIELSDTSGGGATVVANLGSTYNYIPLVEAQFFTQSTGALLRPLNDSTKQIYKRSAVDFVDKHKVKYLGLGIEVNTLYEKSLGDFEAFAQFYSEVYDAVKAKSPTTKVFTVFQLEKMKGLNGGLFGGTNDTTKAQWSLLERFPKSDIIAFTTYPGLIYKNPSEIPLSYYNEINSRTPRPIAFTEIGWHSDASPTGWESGDAEQAEFVRTFLNLTRDLSNELVIWSFMYDQDIIEPFKSMGLRHRTDGTAKPAWDEWVAALTLVERKDQDMPSAFFLSQNYPNPFNPTTTIRFSLPKREHVTLKVFDVLGREVATVVNEWKEAGTHGITFDIRPNSAVAEGSFDILTSGVYFYRLTTPTVSQTKGMMVIK